MVPTVDTSSHERTLVILPTYNEAHSIELLLGRLRQLYEGVDVLVIDDASPDGTAEIAEHFAGRDSRLRVHRRPSKMGLASAYLQGFRYAIDREYERVVEMDADLSHDPNDLSALLVAARSHDLVVGSRYVAGGSVTNWSRARRALSQGGNLYVRMMLGIPLRDATSGFRVYGRRLLRRLMQVPIASEGYAFQIELAYRAWRSGYDVAEVPITFRERERGISKLSRGVIVEALWLVTLWGIRRRLSLEAV